MSGLPAMVSNVEQFGSYLEIFEMCSKCQAKKRRHGQRWCADCRNAYNRQYRKLHPLSETQRIKDRCRSIAGVYKKRGRLKQQPCKKCGSPRSQMHHHDYTKPLEVEWLCRPCHLALHKRELIELKRRKLAEVAQRRQAA